MTISKNNIALTDDEYEQFTHGRTVRKRSANFDGVFTVEVRLVRPRRLTDRFPAALGFTRASIEASRQRRAKATASRKALLATGPA